MSFFGLATIKVQNNTQYNLTDFQVKLELDSNNFPYWYTLRDDGIDIKFTLTDGQTEVPYWREYFNKSEQKAIFWLKVPVVTSDSHTFIQMHFGNSSETVDRSNGNQVFELFDDFTSLDNWTILNGGGQGTATIDGSKLVLNSPDVNNRVVICRQFNVNPTISLGYMIGTLATGINVTTGFTLSYGDGTGSASNDIPENAYTYECFRNGNSKHKILKSENIQLTELATYDISATQDTPYKMEFGWVANCLISRDYRNNVYLKASDNTFDNFSHVHIGVANAIWSFDYIYVRKYVSNATDLNTLDPQFEPLTATIEDISLNTGIIESALVHSNVQQYIETFTGDGSQTVFNLIYKPVIPKVRVFIDNIERIENTDFAVDYTNGQITFTNAPNENSNVTIVYYYGSIDYIENATVRAYVGSDSNEWSSTTTSQYGKYSIEIPKNIEVKLRAETEHTDSITVVKLE